MICSSLSRPGNSSRSKKRIRELGCRSSQLRSHYAPRSTSSSPAHMCVKGAKSVLALEDLVSASSSVRFKSSSPAHMCTNGAKSVPATQDFVSASGFFSVHHHLRQVQNDPRERAEHEMLCKQQQHNDPEHREGDNSDIAVVKSKVNVNHCNQEVRDGFSTE